MTPLWERELPEPSGCDKMRLLTFENQIQI